MNKKLIILGLLGAMAATNVSAANTEFFLTEKTAAEIKDGAYAVVENSQFKEENGVSYIGVDTIKDLFGATEANGVLSLNGNETAVDMTQDMVPLKATLEALGCIVKYSPSLDSVFVSSEAAPIIVNGEKIPVEEFKFYYDVNSISGMSEEQSAMLKASIRDMLIEMAGVSQAAKNSGFSQMMQAEDITAAAKSFRTASDFKEITDTTLDSTYSTTIERRALALNYIEIAQAAINVSEEEVTKFYNDNFVTAKHILIPTIDLATGAALEEKELEEAKKLVKELEEKIAKGEDFDKLMNEYSKDTGLAAYPDGYTFTKGEMVPEFEKAAFELKENEVAPAVETTYGYHIIKKLPLKELEASLKASIEAKLKQDGLNEYIENITKDSVVEVNEEIINSVK